MFEDRFENMIRQYDQALADRRTFVGLIRDLFPEDSKKANLMVSAYDLGIVSEIEKTSVLDRVFARRFINRLQTEYGISKDNAEWAVSTWCVSYGKNILGRACDITIPSVEPASRYSFEDDLAVLKNRIGTMPLTDKIKEEDELLSKLILTANNELSTNACNSALELIEILEADISLGKRKRTPLPPIRNIDTKKRKKEIKALLPTARQKELHYNLVFRTDEELSDALNVASSDEQWSKILSLCNKQEKQFEECIANRWPIPAVSNPEPSKLAAQYQLYQRMIDIDRSINTKRVTRISKRKFRNFLQLCTEQQANIYTCNRNAWDLPALINNNPSELADCAIEERNIAEKKKRIRIMVTSIVVSLCAIGIIVCYNIQQSREGMSRLPFDNSYFSNKDKDIISVRMDLEKAGFKSIVENEDFSEWYKGGTVLKITIDGENNYKKGTYINSNAPIVITYSSKDRIYMTDLLYDWKHQNYENLKQRFEENGCTDIEIVEHRVSDHSLKNRIYTIYLNGIQYYDRKNCYLPKDAPIVITYYKIREVKIGYNADEFSGLTYIDVLKKLEQRGFNNIRPQELTDGWLPGGTVTSVTIDGQSDFHNNTVVEVTVPIVISYSSENRIYIRDLLQGWSHLDYNIVRSTLEDSGFTNIDCIEEPTSNKDQDNQTFSININDKEYHDEECYLPKDAHIIITYYSLQEREIGYNQDELIDHTSDEVVEKLKQRGFTNIILKASTAGWKKPKTVIDITADGIPIDYNRAYNKNTEIQVEYSSEDRVDVSEIMANRRDITIEEFERKLKETGISNIIAVEEPVYDKKQHHMIKCVAIDSKELPENENECFLPLSASVDVTCYKLRIVIGKNAIDFVDNDQYTDTVNLLKNKGFSNIRLQRANDLVMGLFSKEGSIESISINGNKNFKSGDDFDYDSRIVIVVHTFKNKGCKDITDIAP